MITLMEGSSDVFLPPYRPIILEGLHFINDRGCALLGDFMVNDRYIILDAKLVQRNREDRFTRIFIDRQSGKAIRTPYSPISPNNEIPLYITDDGQFVFQSWRRGAQPDKNDETNPELIFYSLIK